MSSKQWYAIGGLSAVEMPFIHGAIQNKLESVQLRRHCNSKATPTSRQSIWHIISIFWVFLFENIAFWEVPPGNHKCRLRGATPLLNVK